MNDHGSLESIRRLAQGELSLAARLGHVALLLVAVGMTAVVVSLWATEPALPGRTRAAFAVMSMIGVAWALFAAWALRARRPLFARDDVIAGTMAVVFTAVFLVGALAAVVVTAAPAAIGAMVTGVALLGFAVWRLVGAQRRFAALAARRVELERALA